MARATASSAELVLRDVEIISEGLRGVMGAENEDLEAKHKLHHAAENLRNALLGFANDVRERKQQSQVAA